MSDPLNEVNLSHMSLIRSMFRIMVSRYREQNFLPGQVCRIFVVLSKKSHCLLDTLPIGRR